MKGNKAGKATGRRSSLGVRCLTLFLICASVLILTSLPLLALVAMAVLPAMNFLAILGNGVTALLVMLFLIGFIAYSIWLLLTGHWAGLIPLLPFLLDWLRSFVWS